MSEKTIRALIADPRDNVATLLAPCDGRCSTILIGPALQQLGSLTVIEPIPTYHKTSIRAIASGEKVTKFGEPIGVASRFIAPGSHVHIHNIDSIRLAGPR